MAEDTLMSLQDELSCSICLSVFDNPVTTPCGHNFCQNCLDLTWQDTDQVALGFNCPQCRTHYYTKPELKKNTVLSNVAEKFRYTSKSENSSDIKTGIKSEPKVDEIVCDTCREKAALKTCLTCMASFCEEHLRPHLENPIFSTHQLNDPLADLRERICPVHHKLMDFFCNKHCQCICMVCIPQFHNGCTFSTPQERQKFQESDLKNKLFVLNGKIEKNQMVISQMKEHEFFLKDSAMSRKRALELEYRKMRELIDMDEEQTMKVVEREQESGQGKMLLLTKKFTQNIQQMKETKEQIERLLDQPQSFKYLQAKVDLPQVASFDPYTPRVNVDSRQVTACQEYAAGLRTLLENMFKQPVEKRLPLLKLDTGNSAAHIGEKGGMPGPSGHGEQYNPHNFTPVCAPSNLGAKKKPPTNKKNDKTDRKMDKSMKNPNIPKDNLKQPGIEVLPGPNKPTPSITSAAKRNDLLHYGTVLTLDPQTAHKRITLSENFTKATVTDEPHSYPDGPARFTVCSQVLCTKGFSYGRHYWEVKMSSKNFCGLGLAYKSIDRKGPASRLGRNMESWCVEWFNVKLSAWHNSIEMVLENPSPSRVGIFLDCEEGTATFYNVAERAYPFHTFIVRFAEAVYPAFWIFSSGSSVTLCKLTN